MRVLAVIPARGGSKRLPGKNIRPLHGKPLIHWSIEFARSVPWITAIEISTDSAEIARCCEDAGHPVKRFRPGPLATDTATSIDVVLDVLAWKADQGKEFDLVALMQPTTPVRSLSHWDRALQLLADIKHDAAIGLGHSTSHPDLTYKMAHGNRVVPWISERPTSLRMQDLEPAYVVNGALYLVRVTTLLAEKTFTPTLTAGVVMDSPLHNLDIDTSFDWLVAEQAIAFLKNKE